MVQIARLLLFPVVPAGLLLILLLRAVWDVDIFWQLKLGELILDNKGPVVAEPFAALHLGEPLSSVAWAGQAAMALARRLGGWDLLRVCDALCWLGGFFTVALASRRRGASLPAVAIALGLAVLAALPTASIRPQSFGCLCFGLLLVLLHARLRLLPTIAFGAPLLVMWQNLHPSVSIGVAAMGFAALPGIVGWLRRRNGLPLTPILLGLIGIVAIFATPDGLSIAATAAANAEISKAFGATEWLPLYAPHNRIVAVPVLVVALLAGWLVVRHRRYDIVELSVAIGLALVTIAAYRFVLFWAVAMVPVIARAATSSASQPKRNVSALVLASLVAVALAAPFLAPTRFSDALPLAAIESLRDHRVRGTVFGDVRFGGLIIDANYPEWRVAYDGRYYRYSAEEWRRYSEIESGLIALDEVERRWRPVAFVLDANRSAALAEELARSERWKRVYAERGVVAYVATPNAAESPSRN